MANPGRARLLPSRTKKTQGGMTPLGITFREVAIASQNVPVPREGEGEARAGAATNAEPDRNALEYDSNLLASIPRSVLPPQVFLVRLTRRFALASHAGTNSKRRRIRGRERRPKWIRLPPLRRLRHQP